MLRSLPVYLVLATLCACGPDNPKYVPPATLVITTSALPAGKVGVFYKQDVKVEGGLEPYVFTLTTGALPAGLDFNVSFGRVSGTPTESGHFAFSVSVASDDMQTASVDLAVDVAPADVAPEALHILPGALPGGSVGVAYSVTFTTDADARAPVVWTVGDGTLPAGLVLGPQTGVLSGVPEVGGSSTFTIVVIDGARRQGSAELAIAIEAPPDLVITTTELPRGNRAEPYLVTLGVEGGVPPYVWRVASGVFPTGVALRGGGVVSGDPAQVGSFDVTIAVRDSAPRPDEAMAMYTVTIEPPWLDLRIVTEGFADAFVGQMWTATLEAVGGKPPYTFALVEGTPPSGVSFSPDAATLLGTPAAGSVGVYELTFTVSDAGDDRHEAQTARTTFELAVYGEPGRPKLLSATARDTSRAGAGVQAGDTLTLRFDRSTDAPIIAAAEAAMYLEVVDKVLGGFTAQWTTSRARDDTLVITFDDSGAAPADVAPGDIVRFPVGGIRDRSGTLGAVGSPPRIQGTFSYEIPLAGSFGVRLRIAPPMDGIEALAAGDLTGDGLPDLVMVSGGFASVVQGDGGLPLGDVDLRDAGAARAEITGQIAMAIVAEVTGDSYADLVLGAPALGLVYVIPGGRAFPSGSVAATAVAAAVLAGDAGGAFGAGLWAFDAVGADGQNDLVVAAPMRGDGGSLYVVAGGASLLHSRSVDGAGAVAARLDGASTVAPGGPDLVVGAPRLSEIIVLADGLGDRRGVIDLSDNANVGSRLRVTTENARFGAMLAIGDVTDDGFPDIVASAPGAGVQGRETAGVVYVFEHPPAGVHDVDGEVLFDTRVVGPSDGSRAGESFAIGDFNRDGHMDLAVGAPDAGEPVAGEAQGHVYVLSGGAGGIVGGRNLAAREDIDLRYEGDDGVDPNGRARPHLGSVVVATDADADRVTDIFAASAGAAYILGVFRDEAPVLVGAARDGDTLVLRFNRPTNQLEVTAENLDQVVRIDGGAAGGLVSAAWTTTRVSNDTLTLTLDGSGTLPASARVDLGPGTIQDELGHLDAIGGARIVVTAH